MSQSPVARAVDGIEKTAEILTPAPVITGGKLSLVGFGRAALQEKLAEIGVPAREQPMRVNQLWHWIYHRGASSFDAMLNVSKTLRATLDDDLAMINVAADDLL